MPLGWGGGKGTVSLCSTSYDNNGKLTRNYLLRCLSLHHKRTGVFFAFQERIKSYGGNSNLLLFILK